MQVLFPIFLDLSINHTPHSFHNCQMEHLKEEERATVNGIVSAGWNGSWAISNIIAGNLMSRNLYEVPFLITCTLYALSTILFYRFFTSLERSH